jgi:hypothetical protein
MDAGGHVDAGGHADGPGADGPADAPLEQDTGVDAPQCIHPVCDYFPQCGCPPGTKCDIDSSGTRKCNPAGTKGHGSLCGAGSGACKPGTTCTSFSGWPSGLYACFQYCTKDADCAALGAGSHCWVKGSYYFLCTLPCDPVAQTGCPTGTQCSLYTSGALAGTNCTAVGTSKLGGTCAVHSDCVGSMVCLNKTCRQLCVVQGAYTCPSSTTCTGSPAIMIGTTKYGVCL